MSRKLIGLLVFAYGSVVHAAARPVPPTATADSDSVLDVSSVDSVLPPPLDLARLGAEDVTQERLGMPPRFAIPERVSITPAHRGTWEDLGDGRMLWRLRIVGGAGTTSLNLGFTRFKMPPQGRLLLYSIDDSQFARPFTAADNEEHGELWTPVVPTADLIVELTVPKAEAQAVELELGWINQGYRGFGTTPAAAYEQAREKSGSCNLDVECLDFGDRWRDEMRAVAVISRGGSTLCSGSLVNNTAGDHKMYFITAHHCGVNSANAASLVAYWNYQNSFCRAPGSAASGQAGDGQLNQFHTGSFFRAAYSPSDVTLVELDDPPAAAYNHRWAGWDRSTGEFACSNATPCAAIHHPSTDEKRITYSTTATLTTSYFGSSPGDGTHIWVQWATDPPGPYTVPGVTEPGSSGSPFYSPEGRVIGQLHGGLSACGATGSSLSDYYGRFNVSWTGGGTNSTRLSKWLDPGNTGAMTLDGIDEASPPTDFYTLTPCRVLDTRKPSGPYGGPALGVGSVRSFAFAGACGIPASAQAVSVNLTVAGPTAAGHLRAYPGGVTPPLTSVINFSAGQTRANNAILPLAADGNGTLTFDAGFAASGTVHLIVDVNGYFQ